MFRLTIISIIAGGSIFAQPELDNLKNTLSATIEQIEAEAKAEANNAGEKYIKQLERVKEEVQAEGSLEKTTEVINEIERFKVSNGPSNGKFRVVSLQQIHDSYTLQLKKNNQQRAEKIRSLFEKYDAALERLKKTMVKEDKLEIARSVKEEQDRARADISKIVAGTNKPATSPESSKPNVQIPSNAVSFGGHKYMLLEKPMSLQDAKDACSKLGGYLLMVESEAEQQFIQGDALGVRNLIDAKQNFWLGIEKNGGKWQWANGLPISYMPKYPNLDRSHGNLESNGVALAHDSWWGCRSDWKNRVICEWPTEK